MSERTKKQQEPEVKQQESAAGQTTKAAQKKTVIYIGPSIKNVVSTGTLYNNGLPKILKEEMTKQPVIKKLIIPVEELSEAQRKLATPGSALATVYGKVITQEDGR